MKIRPGEVEALLRRADPAYAVYLVFGPDMGLVSERARRLAHTAAGAADDPFGLVRLDGDVVAASPGRLMDEAGTVGLFGGRRTVWVGPTSRNIAASVAAVLDASPADAVVVIEAGDLNRNSPLRTLCERAPRAAAIACYADTARDVAALIDEMAREAGLRIAAEARAELTGLLGADRAATRNELQKLMLYAHGDAQIDLDHVRAVVGDVSGVAFDAATDAAFSGRLGDLDRAFMRLEAEGIDPSLALGAALRHALLLVRLTGQMAAGASADAVVEGQRGLHFSRKAAVTRQLKTWHGTDLQDMAARLGDAVARTRRQPSLAFPLARQTLWEAARRARRAG